MKQLTSVAFEISFRRASLTVFRFEKIIITVLLLLINNVAFSQTDKKPSKKISFAAVPIINYKPSIGWSFGAMGQMFYKLNPKDTLSPSSATGIMGIYTTNNSFFGMISQRLYFNEDKWRISFAFGGGNVNFQYWQELPDDAGGFIDYNSEFSFLAMRVERKVIKKLYVGISSTLPKVKITYDVPDYFPDSLKHDDRNLNNIGYILNYDNRDHQLNAYKGFNIMFRNFFYRDFIGSDNDFNKYQLTYNHFYKIRNEKNILATRIRIASASGDVPFQGQNVVGQDDIRGYTSGKYRNDQVYAVQSEYRWRFYKKFGIVGFAGVATAVETISDIPESEFLLGVGAGFRYMVIPKERINIGVDVGFGKEDWGLYFRIGESFGR